MLGFVAHDLPEGRSERDTSDCGYHEQIRLANQTEHTPSPGDGPDPVSACPFYGAIDSGFEVINANKRLRISHVAGLDRIRANVVYTDEWAAQHFVANHSDGSDSQLEADVALAGFHERWGDSVSDLDIAPRYLESTQEQGGPISA